MKIVLATNNAHKVEEMTRILKKDFSDIQILTLSQINFNDEIEETAGTLEGNAIIKAKTVSKHCGMITISDDTGLEVDALNGAPGVYTARYAGENCTKDDNINKMISALKGVPMEKRTARFVCVICGYFPDGRVITADGICEGYIAEERDGTDSFGYDCIFHSTELDKTFGTASANEKDSVSHRGRALKAFLEKFKNESSNT